MGTAFSIIGDIIKVLFYVPAIGVIVCAIVGIAVLVGINKAPEKIQERGDKRRTVEFKEKRKVWAANDRRRQIVEMGRREDAVLAHHDPLRKKAKKMMESTNPKKKAKAQRLLKQYNWLIRKEMSIVHHAANSARVHPGTGQVHKGIRRD